MPVVTKHIIDAVRRFAARRSGLASGLARTAGPEGRQRLRRSRVGPEDPFCEAVRKDLRVPLTLEGPTRTMRGVRAPSLWLFARQPGAHGANRTVGPFRAGRGHRGRVARGLAACGERGQLTGGSAAPGGLSPVGRGRLPPRSRASSPATPRRLPPALPSRQLAFRAVTPAFPQRSRAEDRPGWITVKKVLTGKVVRSVVRSGVVRSGVVRSVVRSAEDDSGFANPSS
jgi:hypothetical protein